MENYENNNNIPEENVNENKENTQNPQYNNGYGYDNRAQYNGYQGGNGQNGYNNYNNGNNGGYYQNGYNQNPGYNYKPNNGGYGYYGGGFNGNINNYPQGSYGYEPKSRIIAGLFGIFMGGIGLHNFYLGYSGRAVAQLLTTVFTLGIGSVWGFIEGIMIIAGSYKNNLDANGVYTKDI